MRECESLSKPFTKLEIDGVVQHLGSLKALGPMAIKPFSNKKNWELVANNVYEVALNVLQGNGIPPQLNDTHIVLISKIDCLELPSRFRPIGLCNVAYKIISKATVNQIKPIIPNFISNTQGNFVPRRKISDNIVILQEVIAQCARNKVLRGIWPLRLTSRMLVTDLVGLSYATHYNK